MSAAADAIDLLKLSGLEQLQQIFRGERPYEGIGKTLGFGVETLEEGRVVFTGEPTKSVYNPIGSVHGGYTATLLDSAVGCAVHSMLKPGQRYTTLELKISYLRAITEKTGRVFAEGRVVNLGRRAAFAEGKITDENGRLYATATSTLLIIE